MSQWPYSVPTSVENEAMAYILYPSCGMWASWDIETYLVCTSFWMARLAMFGWGWRWGWGGRELDIRLLVMGFPLSYDRISIESCVSFVEALEPRSLLRSKARCQPSCLERLAELCYCVLK